MKVRITKCLKEAWWYNDRIGEVFDVEEIYGDNQSYFGNYVLVIEPNIEKREQYGILKEDCEEI